MVLSEQLAKAKVTAPLELSGNRKAVRNQRHSKVTQAVKISLRDKGIDKKKQVPCRLCSTLRSGPKQAMVLFTSEVLE